MNPMAYQASPFSPWSQVALNPNMMTSQPSPYAHPYYLSASYMPMYTQAGTQYMSYQPNLFQSPQETRSISSSSAEPDATRSSNTVYKTMSASQRHTNDFYSTIQMQPWQPHMQLVPSDRSTFQTIQIFNDRQGSGRAGERPSSSPSCALMWLMCSNMVDVL
ncbi:hypothetical protein GUITHDRAFT_110818 [Guillardia theta CCMP2712]|uniref:Uncharacterized protein n=1 Tax=Guillardia theta (strain CCMP2712) TaxID=905079 RepID=L1J3I6_GUITC|nr:hypothetical protein GUITHDRAFT_110818 [Guillardia theta CCMP2712]EKX43093.1 hypothetical protein GUITHDRAFT_110818 [Guillardia theta CCMP2712]|eukprot:XP_005830073.1 hypothetical protein GUITHDRAFT_110818 [Guillardia theta CCMP2712]